MSSVRLTILILGGYGIFGGRLATLLAAEPRLTLVIAGRSMAKAKQFCDRLPPGAQKIPMELDRDASLDGALAATMPDILVDASGPFQAYGEAPYRVVEACLARGIDYLDLADGSDFVQGIAAFDDEARQRGITILSGASSFPVLTAAVVRHLAMSLERVDSIEAGIAPSPYAGVGLNVIRAITSYAGQPMGLLRDGRPAVGYALTDSKRYTIAPPGMLPLRNLRFSLVDVPDLKVLPALWPELRAIWIGAGPVPEVLHRMLTGLAWLVRLGILRSLLPFAGLFYRAINILRWGEHRGGMFVVVAGTRAGRPVERSWHLLAEGDDGPYIPSMAIEALVRHRLEGKRPSSGARPMIRELELSDYRSVFRTRAIAFGTREVADDGALPLYQRLLGESWFRLPDALRAMHDIGGGLVAEGIAEVEHGRNPLARLIAFLFALPPPGRAIPVAVRFTPTPDGEIWTRQFGGHHFSTTQSAGRGRWEWLVVERFGPVAFGIALVIDRSRLLLRLRRWSLFGLPLPLWLGPRSDAYEHAEGGRFNFDVAISHPLTRLLVRYRGWLVPSRNAEATRAIAAD